MLKVFTGISLLTLFLLGGIVLLPEKTLAEGDCQYEANYDRSLSIAPTGGDFNTTVKITANLSWKTEDTVCLNLPLTFRYKIIATDRDGNSSTVEDSGKIGKNKTLKGKTLTYEAEIKLSDINPGWVGSLQEVVSYGDKLEFQFIVDELFPNDPVIKNFVLGTTVSKICAFEEKDQTRCIKDSEELAEQNKCNKAKGGVDANSVPVDCSKGGCRVVDGSKCSNISDWDGPDDISLQGGDFGFKLTNPWCPKDEPDCKGSIEDIVLWALGLLLNLGITLAILFVVYNGFKLMVSAGDVGKVTAARKGIGYAALGLLLMLIGKGFVTLILSILETLGKK